MSKKGTICMCSSCKSQYLVSGFFLLEVLTGGKECTTCGGKVETIIANLKKADRNS